MGLRDLLLLVTVYGSIPFILRKPFVGILVWYWLSLMNPHRHQLVIGKPSARANYRHCHARQLTDRPPGKEVHTEHADHYYLGCILGMDAVDYGLRILSR